MEGFDDDQIIDLSAAGELRPIPCRLAGTFGQPGWYDDVKFNNQALEKIERALRLIGIAPESFEWRPCDPARPPLIQAWKRSLRMMPGCFSAARAG